MSLPYVAIWRVPPERLRANISESSLSPPRKWASAVPPPHPVFRKTIAVQLLALPLLRRFPPLSAFGFAPRPLRFLQSGFRAVPSVEPRKNRRTESETRAIPHRTSTYVSENPSTRYKSDTAPHRKQARENATTNVDSSGPLLVRFPNHSAACRK